MLSSHPNTEWCRTVADALLRLGIRRVVVCPGTRSAAMVAAMRERSHLRLHFQTDERSAGFFAIGLHKELLEPVAICTTSGSAVANLVPCLTEAHADGLPLVVLSCDRPKHLRGSGLLQMTRQVEFCAPLVRTCLDLSDPVQDAHARDSLRNRFGGLMVYLRLGPERGPVQVNLPLLGSGCSVDGDHGWSGSITESLPPIYPDMPPSGSADESRVREVVRRLGLRPGLKGLIVAGPRVELDTDRVEEFAAATGYPLLLDAPGHLRSAIRTGAIAEGDVLVGRAGIADLKADLIIRLGETPVTSATQEFIAAQACPTLRIVDRPIQRDFLASSLEQLLAPNPAELRLLGQALHPGDAEWKERWTSEALVCRQRIDLGSRSLGWGELLAVGTALRSPVFDFVHAANSTPIRMVNLLMAGGTGRPVYANRGVSGIDGTIGTFLGELAARRRRGLLVIGDLAMLHDIPALEAAQRDQLRGVILIVNNGGAGLFDHMSVATLPGYDSVYRHPVNVDFSGVAQAFGIRHARCSDLTSLRVAMGQARQREGLEIVEAIVPRKPGGPPEAARLLLYCSQ